MTLLEQMSRRGSAGNDMSFSRPGFKVCMDTGMPGGGVPLGSAGYDYYRSKGVSFARVAYAVAASNPYVRDNVSPPGVKQQLQAGQSSYPWLAPYIDYWYIDNESAYYTWDTNGTTGATRCIADTASMTSWLVADIPAYTSFVGTPKIGAYSGAPAGILAPPSSFWKQYSPYQLSVYRSYNDACGATVGTYWNFAFPEMYSSTIDETVGLMDWTAAEKVRTGLTNLKILPLIWPTRNTCTATGSVSGTTMTISAISSGSFTVGDSLNSQVYGTGITNGTYIVSQISGSTGLTGDYQLSANLGTLGSRTIQQDTNARSATFVTAMLEYAIRQPQIDGIAFWAIDNIYPIAGTYLDGLPWMSAMTAFIAKYGLSPGFPA